MYLERSKIDLSPHGSATAHAVDVHPASFDKQGNGHYTMLNGEVWIYRAAWFAGRGVIDGKPVRCLTAEAQVACHAGYELDEYDLRDMEALHRRFRIKLLPEHRRTSA